MEINKINKFLIYFFSVFVLIFGAFGATLTCTQISDASVSLTQFASKTIEVQCSASGGTVSNIQISANSNPSTGLDISSSQTISSSLTDSSTDSAKWTITGQSPNTYSMTYTISSSSTNAWSGTDTTQVTVNSPAQLTIEYVSAPSTYSSSDTLDVKIKNIGGTTANNVKLQLNSDSKVDYPSTISAGSTASFSWSSSTGYSVANTYVTKVYIETTQQDSVSTTVATATASSNNTNSNSNSNSGGPSSSTTPTPTPIITPVVTTPVTPTPKVDTITPAPNEVINNDVVEVVKKTFEQNIAETLNIDVSDIKEIVEINTIVLDEKKVEEVTTENIENVLENFDVIVIESIKNIVSDSKSIKSDVSTTVKTYEVVKSDGTKSKVTKVEKKVKVNLKDAIGDVVRLIEVIPKFVAKSASLVNGNFKVIVADPVIAFDINVKDVPSSGEVVLDYNIEGDVASKIKDTKSVVVLSNDKSLIKSNNVVVNDTTNKITDYVTNSSNWWKIILIIVLVLIVFGIVIGYFILERRHKLEMNDENSSNSEYVYKEESKKSNIEREEFVDENELVDDIDESK